MLFRVVANTTQLKPSGIANLLVKGDLEGDIKTSKLQVNGLINSKRLEDVLGNIVQKSSKFEVFGEKRFKSLHVKDLEIPDHSNIFRLLQTVTRGGEITLQNNLNLFNNISINRLQFGGRLNDLWRADFDELMHLESNPEETVLIPSDVQFNKLVVLGEVSVADNAINGKNLTAIEQDTVKVDEDHVFHSGVFGEGNRKTQMSECLESGGFSEETVTVDDNLRLYGNVENLDLDFVVLQNASRVQEISGTVFNKTLSVNGTLVIHRAVNGVDLHKVCQFSRRSDQPKSMKIFGKET